jgi:hypothetical protein
LIEIVILDKVLSALSFITPFILYGGIIFVLSTNISSSGLCYQYFHRIILRFKEYLLIKGFLNRFDVTNDKHYTKPISNLFHRINNHR